MFKSDLELICATSQNSQGQTVKDVGPLCDLTFKAFQKSIVDLKPEFHSAAPIVVEQDQLFQRVVFSRLR